MTTINIPEILNTTEQEKIIKEQSELFRDCLFLFNDEKLEDIILNLHKKLF